MHRRPSFENAKQYAPFKIAALVETLAEQKVPVERALSGTGISPEHLQNAFLRTSVRQYVQVCLNALSLSTNVRIPFVTGRRLHLFAYGMYGYALMSCVSLRDYFVLGTKYHLLATPILSIRWRECADAAIWEFPDEFSFAPSQELRRFLIEQQLTQHVTHLQDVAGGQIWPILAKLSYAKPDHFELYREYLGCECYFGQEKCELHYSKDILDQRPPLAHAMTSALLQQTCERLIGQLATSGSVGAEVYQLLMRSPQRFSSMQTIAKSMNMVERTLRRRLTEEGFSFADMLTDVRRSLSIEYLTATELSVEDISVLVGFNDVANFRKAFKRWTGEAPGAFRQGTARTHTIIDESIVSEV